MTDTGKVTKADATANMTNDNSANNNPPHNTNPPGRAVASRDFVDGWTLGQTLGEGTYGEVRMLINRQTGEAVAMKAIDLKKHSDAVLSVRKEICIQKMLSDPHILQFYGNRRQGHIEYIFLEYAAGGELFDRIEPDVGMPQHEAQRYFKQLLAGLQYIHQRGVAHRDLKPENVLLDEHDNIKICDFGMATMFRCKGKERLLDKRCGTLPYVAPEVFIKPYHAQPADVWSCGIILVTMLAGELPWDQPSPNCREFMNWKENDLWSTQTPWSKLDPLVISFLRRVLYINPAYRLTVAKILEHKWCQMQFNDANNDRSHDLADSAAALEICSPKAKRRCDQQQLQQNQQQISGNRSNRCNSFHLPDDDTMIRNYCSQPLPVVNQGFDGTLLSERRNKQKLEMNATKTANNTATNDLLRTTAGNNAIASSAVNPQEHRLGFSFSQPAMLEDLLICSQTTQQTNSLSQTQNVFQRLVKRMTRFFVTIRHEDAVKRLRDVCEHLGYTCKLSDDCLTLTINTVDKRKLRLIFKALVIEMDRNVLLDFRLSKGCGLEFKRRFMKIKEMMEDVVLRGPVTWPIAIATNTVP